MLPTSKYKENLHQDFFTMKICSLITLRPYFGFQKVFNVDVFAINFFDTMTDFNPNINIFFQQCSILNQNIDLVSPSQPFT